MTLQRGRQEPHRPRRRANYAPPAYCARSPRDPRGHAGWLIRASRKEQNGRPWRASRFIVQLATIAPPAFRPACELNRRDSPERASLAIREAMTVNGPLPTEKLINSQFVSLARLIEAQKTAANSRNDFRFATDHPALGFFWRQISNRLTDYRPDQSHSAHDFDIVARPLYSLLSKPICLT